MSRTPLNNQHPPFLAEEPTSVEIGDFDPTAKKWPRIVKEFDPKVVFPKFEKRKTVEREKRKRIRWLRNADNVRFDEPSYTNRITILSQLEKCKPGARCRQNYCPVCMRRYRRGYVSQMLRVHGDASPLYFITYVRTEYVFSDLSDAENKGQSLKRQFMKVVSRNLPQRVILTGYIEYKFEPSFGRHAPHIHALVSGCEYFELNKIRPKMKKEWKSGGEKKEIMPNKTARRPALLHISTVRQGREARVATYLCKQFPRHQSGGDARRTKRRRYPTEDERRQRALADMNLKSHLRSAETRQVLSGVTFANGDSLRKTRRK